MAKIALLYMKFPCAIGIYFDAAFRETEHELLSACPYSGTWMPWKGGMHVPEKYAIPPDYEIPWGSGLEKNWRNYSFANLEELVGTQDVWVVIDAGLYRPTGRPKSGIVVWIATDPHSVDYEEQRKQADLFFNMQRCYVKPGDIWLPYAYSPRWHYPVDAEREHDVMFIGRPDPQRVAMLLLMAQRGYKTHYNYGIVFDEARKQYAKTHLVFNWSIKDDTNARVFEAMAMGRALVTDRTLDLNHLPFEDEIHYMGFDVVDEGLERMEWLLGHDDERRQMEEAALKAVLPHSYNARVKKILEAAEKI